MQIASFPQGRNGSWMPPCKLRPLQSNGTLEWDRSKDNLELRANYLLVEDGGHFILGTVDSPMNLAATVYITNGPHSDPELGRRFLGGRGTGQKLG